MQCFNMRVPRLIHGCGLGLSERLLETTAEIQEVCITSLLAIRPSLCPCALNMFKEKKNPSVEK